MRKVPSFTTTCVRHGSLQLDFQAVFEALKRIFHYSHFSRFGRDCDFQRLMFLTATFISLSKLFSILFFHLFRITNTSLLQNFRLVLFLYDLIFVTLSSLQLFGVCFLGPLEILSVRLLQELHILLCFQQVTI
jgi:hypothetical protein